jgi:prepilin-type N-terminal cleavage/methylation domain-containing protein
LFREISGSVLRSGPPRADGCQVKIRRGESREERGFTLLEMMMALLLLGLVMGALAPAFYGLLRATSVTSQHSVANGLAVTATEQLRSIPYDEVGFHTTPSSCPSSNAVVLGASVAAPMAGMATSQTIGNTSYRIQRCVNWVNSSVSADTLAYKQAVVTVSWRSSTLAVSVAQTSALYPGGQTAYSGPENDYIPGATTTTTAVVAPSPPTGVTATDDSSAPTNTIDVSWTPPTSTPTPDHYVVLWSTTNPSGGSIATLSGYSSSSQLTGTSTLITVGAGTTYYFQVESIAAGQTSTLVSNTATATTTSGSTTTTTTAPTTTTTVGGGGGGSTTTTSTSTTSTTSTTLLTCSINTLTVTPSVGTNGNGVAVDKNGYLVNESYFTLSVNASSGCSNVTVGYAPSTCTPGATGCQTTYATMSGTGGTIYGTAGSGSTVWTVGTQKFTVFARGSQYSPLTQQQVIVCTENGNSGKC